MNQREYYKQLYALAERCKVEVEYWQNQHQQFMDSIAEIENHDCKLDANGEGHCDNPMHPEEEIELPF